jgi:hypothetical protein
MTIKLSKRPTPVNIYRKRPIEIDTEEEENIEIEENNDSVVIEVPFNPADIRVSTQPHTLGDLIERLEHGEIRLHSDFQRLPNLWNNTQKSRLLETVLLRLPIPTFYFDGKDDNKWEVIDGLQRISTLRSFVLDKNLVLENLEFLKEYNGGTYDTLPRELQRRIKTFPITVYILEKGTPVEVKYNIFSRLNQGGLILTAQELRNALHQGEPAKLVADLVRGSREEYKDEKGRETIIKEATEEGKMFVKVTGGNIPSRRMQDRDFATRFVSFYLTDYIDYTPDMDSFMSAGMEKINKLTDEQIAVLKKDYMKALNTAWDIFDNDAFRKRLNPDDPRKPINKALFDSLSVNFAKLTDQQCGVLIGKKEIFKKIFIALHNSEDGKFIRSLTQGTALKANVVQRFSDIRKIIEAVLKNDD